MAIWRAQVEFGSATNLPADKYVNTFHFEGSPTATDTMNIDDMLVDFYSVDYAGSPLLNRYPSTLFNGDYEVKIYCLDDPEPRVPRAEYSHDWTPISGDGLPSEIALVMSYHAAPVAGESQARRRGRIYLGPFGEGMNSSNRPSNDLITDICAAAAALKAAADASVTWQWVVYSRAASAGYHVVGGWVDDAWDTQRRRGWERTARTLWS